MALRTSSYSQKRTYGYMLAYHFLTPMIQTQENKILNHCPVQSDRQKGLIPGADNPGKMTQSLLKWPDFTALKTKL